MRYEKRKYILPRCDNVTGALKEQRGGSSKCLCGFQLPPKIWEEENKIFPQDLLHTFIYILQVLVSQFFLNFQISNQRKWKYKQNATKKILSKYSIKEKKERNTYKCTTKFSSIQWVSVSLKKFFRNSRSAVGLCNIIVNCQVKIAEVFLSSAVQYYLLLSCFYFCSSKFKFKETHSIEILGQ